MRTLVKTLFLFFIFPRFVCAYEIRHAQSEVGTLVKKCSPLHEDGLPEKIDFVSCDGRQVGKIENGYCSNHIDSCEKKSSNSAIENGYSGGPLPKLPEPKPAK